MISLESGLYNNATLTLCFNYNNRKILEQLTKSFC